jgi:hypothetical protein
MVSATDPHGRVLGLLDRTVCLLLTIMNRATPSTKNHLGKKKIFQMFKKIPVILWNSSVHRRCVHNTIHSIASRAVDLCTNILLLCTPGSPTWPLQ